MKTSLPKIAVALVLVTILSIRNLHAQSTAFTYQGRLNDNGSATTGSYDLQFAVYDAASNGNSVGSALTNSATSVSNGLFVVQLDFGAAIFNGSDRWLEIGVRTNGSAGAFTILSPRQQITSMPYAIQSANATSATMAASANSVSAANISGTLALAQLPGVLVTNNSSSVNLSGTFAGSGTGMTNVNAASLSGLNATNFWQGGGNTVAAGQFLGSVNNQAVEVRVNNQRVWELDPNGTGGAAPNIIGGAPINFVAAGATGATIAGGGSGLFGYTNRVTGSYGVISGGASNSAVASATVAGGFQNNAGGIGGSVGGGINNQATSPYATVPGGSNNVAGGQFSFAAGQQAQATNDGAFVWADSQNTPFASTNNDSFNVRARGGAQFVTGGAGMSIDSQPVLTTASGPVGISLQQNSSGAPNVIEGAPINYVAGSVIGATIGGGGATNSSGSVYSNSVTGNFGTVAGGAANAAVAQASVGGGEFNVASGGSSTVGGGTLNTASGSAATIAGGIENVSSGYGSFVGGGGSDGTGAPGNHATGNASTIGGGYGNWATNRFSTVTGGVENDGYGSGAFIGGGGYDGANFSGNVASGGASTVAGGLGNQATNNCTVIPGGANNLAGGLYSFAAGQQAQALHQGSFVWADSQNAAFASTNNDSFNVRAAGGVRFVTSGTGMSLDGPLNLPTNVNFTSSGYTALHIDNVNFQGDTFLGVAAGNLSALGLGDTAIGNTAMGFNTSGSQNTAVGAYSLYHNATGNNNTAIGGMTLNSARGSGNIAVGYQAGANLSSSEANDIYIGNAGTAGESSTIRIGTPGTQSSTYLAGAINGNGSGLTNLNANNLSSGTVPDARLSGTYTSALTLNNTGNSYSGSGANLTSLNASNLASGTVALARLPTAVVTNNDSNVTFNGAFTLSNAGTSLSITPGYLFATASNNCVTLDVPGFAQKIAIWDNLYVSDNVYASGNVYANGTQLTSDRNAKENFMAVDPQQVLEKVAALPVSEWNYKKVAPQEKHLGPVAQDFHAAFGLNGDDDTHIFASDESGVALAAIKALNEKVDEQNTELKQKETEIEQLREELQKLEHVVGSKILTSK